MFPSFDKHWLPLKKKNGFRSGPLARSVFFSSSSFFLQSSLYHLKPPRPPRSRVRAQARSHTRERASEVGSKRGLGRGVKQAAASPTASGKTTAAALQQRREREKKKTKTLFSSSSPCLQRASLRVSPRVVSWARARTKKATVSVRGGGAAKRGGERGGDRSFCARVFAAGRFFFPKEAAGLTPSLSHRDPFSPLLPRCRPRPPRGAVLSLRLRVLLLLSSVSSLRLPWSSPFF